MQTEALDEILTFDGIGSEYDSDEKLLQLYLLTLFSLSTTRDIRYLVLSGGWRSSTDYCSWDNVECDIDGQVVALYLGK